MPASRRRIAAIGVVALCAAPGGTIPRRHADPCHLPEATGRDREADAVPFVRLRARGGVEIGFQRLSVADAAALLAARVRGSPPYTQVAYFYPVPWGRCADARVLVGAVRDAGGRAYDAFRTFPEMRTMPAPIRGERRYPAP